MSDKETGIDFGAGASYSHNGGWKIHTWKEDRKKDSEEFKSSPEYDAEILRDERIVEKVRREREKEALKEEEKVEEEK